MKKAISERNIVALLFVAVLIIFSFADRDSKKLNKLYSAAASIKISAQYIVKK